LDLGTLFKGAMQVYSRTGDERDHSKQKGRAIVCGSAMGGGRTDLQIKDSKKSRMLTVKGYGDLPSEIRAVHGKKRFSKKVCEFETGKCILGAVKH